MTPSVLLARAEAQLDELRAMDDGLPPSPKLRALLEEAEEAVAKAKIACDNWTPPEPKPVRKFSYDYFAPAPIDGDYLDPNEETDIEEEIDSIIRSERRGRFFPAK